MDHPHVVQCGDVMFDNTLHFATRAAERSTLLAHLGLEGKEYVLATVHRDANTDVGERLNAIFRALLELHRTHGLDVVLPLHPRTRKMMDSLLSPEVRQALLQTPGLHLIPPAGFLDMIALESNARLVLTDSGGVQKEAYFVGRPCVILRPETEWVELVERGQAVLADAEPERIRDAADRFLRDGAPPCPPLFGDGRAAEHICIQLLRFR
jgi:UDP-GlcNAc3NAcA epimerase